MPGGKLGDPVNEGHKYRDLLIQVVGMEARLTLLLPQKNII
jgi:hypothetical protein